MVGTCGLPPDGGQGATFRFSVPTDVTQSSADCRSFRRSRVSEGSPFLGLPAAVRSTIYSARSLSHKTPCKYEVSTLRNSAATRSCDFGSASRQSVLMPFTI
jgi:hypothetical protein